MNSAFTCNFLTIDQKTLIPQCFLIYRKLCLQLLPKLNYNFIKWYKIKLTAVGDGCGHSNICTPIKKQLINKNVKNTFYWQKILRSDILINKQFYCLNGWGLVTFNAYVILSDFFLHLVVLLLLHSIIFVFFIGCEKRSLYAENYINIYLEKKYKTNNNYVSNYWLMAGNKANAISSERMMRMF